MTNQEKLTQYIKENYNDIEFDPNEGDEYHIVEEGKWEDDGKWQYKTTIVSLNGEQFLINESRSGSYYTDWTYGELYIYPVERVEKVKVVVSWETNGEPIVIEPKY